MPGVAQGRIDMKDDAAGPAERDSGIELAETLHPRFYRDPELFSLAKEALFPASWQFVSWRSQLKAPGHVIPVKVLEGFLDEPLVLTRDTADDIYCLSNVCTHRGNLLVEGECHTTSMRCRYHGRRFASDGTMTSAPGFDGVADFPRQCDHLSRLRLRFWKELGLCIPSPEEPLFDFDELIAPLQSRLSWLPLQEFRHHPELSRDYLVRANWALYVENYLEGFHIPYVHPALAGALDTQQYSTELFDYASLQLGIAGSASEAFQLPSDSPDKGRFVAAYYFYLFPNLMLNFYPWGLSINVVVPLAVDLTRVRFISYIWKDELLSTGAGADLDRVEREDEAIVENVQKGMASRFYRAGRYAPDEEQGVYHFHRLLRSFLEPHAAGTAGEA